jgi:hypothetical protein
MTFTQVNRGSKFLPDHLARLNIPRLNELERRKHNQLLLSSPRGLLISPATAGEEAFLLPASRIAYAKLRRVLTQASE